MKKSKSIFLFLMTLLFVACSSTQSLQEYYVDNAENPNFISIDLPVSLLHLTKANLATDERDAMESLKKINVLAFKKDDMNEPAYIVEKTKVNNILKNSDFNELMKMNTPFGKATVKYLGDDDTIDEVVIFGDRKEDGFVLVRILGDDMNPLHFMKLMKAIEKSDVNKEGLDSIGELLRG